MLINVSQVVSAIDVLYNSRETLFNEKLYTVTKESYTDYSVLYSSCLPAVGVVSSL